MAKAQRMGQPCRKRTYRIPGPSSAPKLSTEWIRPITFSMLPPLPFLQPVCLKPGVEGAVDDIELLLLVSLMKLTA